MKRHSNMNITFFRLVFILFRFHHIFSAPPLELLAQLISCRTTHNARTGTLVPNKSVALSASACQVSLH